MIFVQVSLLLRYCTALAQILFLCFSFSVYASMPHFYYHSEKGHSDSRLGVYLLYSRAMNELYSDALLSFVSSFVDPGPTVPMEADWVLPCGGKSLPLVDPVTDLEIQCGGQGKLFQTTHVRSPG